MPISTRLLLLTLLAAAAPLAVSIAAPLAAQTAARAESTITAPVILRDIATLASDRFEARAPGTRGEDSTVSYLERRFREIGLRPGNPDGGYVQRVPLVGTTSTVEARTTFGGRTETLAPLADIVAWSLRPDTLVATPASEMVFVGYGVVAPEYAWDDFKGVDVRGKVVVMLVGDPPVPDPRDSTRLADSLSDVERGVGVQTRGGGTVGSPLSSRRSERSERVSGHGVPCSAPDCNHQMPDAPIR